jgi:hypothetical protein
MDAEQKNQQSPQRESNICRKCGKEATDDQVYCSNCGDPLNGGLKKESPSSPRDLVSSDEEEQRRLIKEARISIMVVVVVIIISSLLRWLQLESELSKIAPMLVDQDAVDMARVSIVGDFLLSAFFIFLFFLAKSSPFGATLTGFIVFITIIIVSAVIEPKSLIMGILLKILIIAVLVNGLRAGIGYKKIRGHSK